MVKRGRAGYAMEKAHSKEATQENILDEIAPKKKAVRKEQEAPPQPLLNVKHIVVAVIVLLILFALFTFVVSLQSKKANMSIADYHALNYEGDESDINFLYNEHSFVKARGLWHTDLTDKTGTKIYELRFRYSPKEVLNVSVVGTGLDEKFYNAKELYMSFNPEAEQMNYVALAAAEMTLPLSAVVKYDIIASCQKNVTEGCESIPTVTCESHPDSLVIEIHEGGNEGVAFEGNCIVVDGDGENLMRAADRLIYEWLGIIRN